MVNIKRKIKIGIFLLILSFGAVFISASLNNNIVKASSTVSSQANTAIVNLETSLKRNWLGPKNLPAFNTYLKNAKALTSRLSNGSVKTSYNNRIAETERIIRAIEKMVVLETSLEKNYHGMKNIPAFKAYLTDASNAIYAIKTIECKYKLSDRVYVAFNTIRDIETVNSTEYKKAANAFVEGRKAYRKALEDKTVESKNKALELSNSALNLVWSINTSIAKDYIAGDVRDLISQINAIKTVEKPVEEPKDTNEKEESKESIEKQSVNSVKKEEVNNIEKEEINDTEKASEKEESKTLNEEESPQIQE